MPTQGRFIVIEGLEGAGKSTIINTIKSFLDAKVPKVMITREPGGTRVGEVVRSLIKEQVFGEPLDNRTELLLLYAARTQLVEQVIRPALDKGDWVIADRFELSTFAYQGGGRHIDKNVIAQLSTISLQGFKPDLIIFLDISPEEGLQRVKRRGVSDRIERETMVFFNDVYQTYHQTIKTMDNVVTVDASQSVEAVQQSVIDHLKHFISSNVSA